MPSTPTSVPHPETGTILDGLLSGTYWLNSNLTWATADNPYELYYWLNPGAATPTINAIIQQFASVTQLTFAHSGHFSDFTQSTGDITITWTDVFPDTLAAAVFPYTASGDSMLLGLGFTRPEWPQPEGDLGINFSQQSVLIASPSLLLWVGLHEIGHALGLKHPHDGGPVGFPTFDELGIASWDSVLATVMSYEDYNGAYPSTLMPLDIAALQYLYGANPNTFAGDTAHQLTNDGLIRTIYDAGGVDTLDGSSLTVAASIDLGGFPGNSTVGATTVVALAIGTVIENANGGSGADQILGNDANNVLRGNGGNDVLDGWIGNDELHGGDGVDTLLGWDGADQLFGGNHADLLLGEGGNDTLNGGAGVDAALLELSSSAATWTRTVSGAWTVSSAEGTDTLTGVEFLSFTDRDVFLDRAQRTFSGNGTSDVLFRRADGIMASWEVTGTSINAASFLPTASAEWSALGTGDVSDDGRDDVLWQRTDGLVYAWVMNGGAVSAAVGLAGLGAEWDFLGMGDFNGDLTDDFAWRRNDGVVFTWTMQNSAIQSANGVTGLGAAWQIAGFGDFNGDGRDDFLWRNVNTGQSVVWHMNGSAIQSSDATSEQAGLDWAVVGVGDTDGDGRDDIILQRASDGMIAVWAMDGTSVLSATEVAAANPAQWTVRGIGDYNGDGREDILWQHDNGLVYVWLMNGAAIQSAGALAGIGPDWGII